MARNRIPDPLKRRHLVERNQAPDQALAIGEAYLAEGRVFEALDFLRKAQAGERLAELRARAVSEGDAFLLRAVARADGTPPTHAEWSELGTAAAAAGKERYAADARRQAERVEG